MSSQNLTDQVSPEYQRFFAKFSQIETRPINEWNKICILAYLCKKYEEHYEMKFTFSYQGVPSKCRELYEITKLSNQLSSDPEILKKYIDWVFKTKVIERKKRITSLGYFTNVEIVNDYKFKFLFKKQVIARTDRLPQNLVAMCMRHGFSAHTYGELSFISKMPDQERLIEELKSISFPMDILDKII